MDTHSRISKWSFCSATLSIWWSICKYVSISASYSSFRNFPHLAVVFILFIFVKNIVTSKTKKSCAAITPAQTIVFKCHEYTAQFAQLASQLKPKSSDVTRTLHSLRSHQASTNKSLQVSQEHCTVCAAACQHKHVFKCYKYTTQPAQPASQLKPKSSNVTSTLHSMRSQQASSNQSLQMLRVHYIVCAVINQAQTKVFKCHEYTT
jgi:hypothetical protein